MTPTQRPWIPRLLALLALLAVAACNFFNPSGTSDQANVTADDWIQSGQEDLRDLKFESAFHAFSTALSIDSNKSLAWHGLAKSVLGKDSFTISKLVELADTMGKVADDKKLDVLLGLGDTGITDLYRPLMRVASIYDRFRVRDSLGKTDHVFGTHLILTELSTIYNNRSYFLLIDANRDTVVQRGELAGLKMMSIATGGLEVSPAKLIEQGGMDTATGALPDSTRDNINGILNNVTAITADTNILNQLLAGGGGGSSDGGSKANAELNTQAKSFIQKLGSSTSFFLINDSLDNDADGCVNEEVFGDSLDNDGDGLKDEDGRVGLRTKTPPADGVLSQRTPPDGFRHDAMQIVTVAGVKALAVIPTNLLTMDESAVLTYEDGTGLVQLFKGLRWVSRSDSSAGVRNDTIWTRVLADEGVTDIHAITESKLSEVKMLATIEVRKKVFAETDIEKRVALGKKIVGGCWDNVKP